MNRGEVLEEQNFRARNSHTSPRTLRNRAITVDAPHRQACEREAYSNAPRAPKVQGGGDQKTVAKKKAKKAKKK
jgi:hypothetical protein